MKEKETNRVIFENITHEKTIEEWIYIERGILKSIYYGISNMMETGANEDDKSDIIIALDFALCLHSEITKKFINSEE